MGVRVITMIKKYKKILLIGGFVFGYIIFWGWFFGEKDIAIEEVAVKQEKNIVANNDTDEKSDTEDDIKEQFTEFGNFWIQIDTDDIKIKAPIVDGVTDEKLAQGVGRHKTTVLPSDEGGNMVLSGHRWKFGKNPAYKVFEDIDKLEVGNHVTIHYYGKEFVYKITERKTVGGKAVEILEQTDEPMLTFYTCTPKHTAFRRLVYRAKLLRD